MFAKIEKSELSQMLLFPCLYFILVFFGARTFGLRLFYAVFKTLYAQATRAPPLVQALQADTWRAALLMRPGPWEIWSFDGKFQQ